MDSQIQTQKQKFFELRLVHAEHLDEYCELAYESIVRWDESGS